MESAPRSKLLQAFAVGLQREAVAYAAGRKDGEEGANFRPLDFDLFSYASGFVYGRQFPKLQFLRSGGDHGRTLRSNA